MVVCWSSIMPLNSVSLTTSRHLFSILERFPLFSHQLSGWHLEHIRFRRSWSWNFWRQTVFETRDSSAWASWSSSVFHSAQVLSSIAGNSMESNQNQELLREIKHDQQRLISQIQLGMQLFTKSQFENNTGLQIYHFHPMIRIIFFYSKHLFYSVSEYFHFGRQQIAPFAHQQC